MKAQLNLSIGQHLTLTPQLQQAIRLLQLSSLELNQEIQELVEKNPMLDLEGSLPSPEQSHAKAEVESGATKPEVSQETIAEANWEQHYNRPTKSNASSDDAPNFENMHATQESLHDYLIWQMELTPLSDTDVLIAEAIIDAIDEKGFLTVSLSDIQTTAQHDQNDLIELDEIEAVLHRIQRFDPIGVGSRDLSECLYVQLSQFDPATPHLKNAMEIVKNHIELLGQRHYKQIIKKLKINAEELQACLALIQTLHPHPGDLVAGKSTEYIIPDVLVSKIKGQWQVALNPESLPKVAINKHYANLIKRADTSTDNTFLKNNLQEARWFLKSLQSRHDTLLKVATSIVKHQQDFLELGEEAMKPLVLHDIAEMLDLHESTISRVTTNKYMHTPRGVFELKYFFSSHVGTDGGGECSSTAIRAVIRKLISNENPNKPLSDHKIALVLQQKGIKVARRTIAKYREALRIPPSNERKELVKS